MTVSKISFHAALLLGFALTTGAVGVKDQLAPLVPGAVKLEGYPGERLAQCVEHRILPQDTESLLALNRARTLDPGGFKGEFIGKWLTAAALGCRYQPNPALDQKMRRAADELIKTASADGYISTYQPEDDFKVWDVWNQKYVLLGLIGQYDQTKEPAYLAAARRSADHLIRLNGPGRLSIEEYGPPIHKGGCNYSILEPIVLLYERTGEKRYLDFAISIVEAWSKPSKYTDHGVRIIENAETGVPLVAGAVLHSYAFMSCIEGLCELYRATGNPRYLNGAVKVAEAIQREELMITGSVSNHEMWYGGNLEQTEMLEKPVETCATATWLKLCYQLLRLTGDSAWADHMEVSLYNALDGAMTPRGEWWSYDSPLAGERVPSRVQGLNLSCCVSSGPRGLLLTPQWATMTGTNGEVVVNLYAPGSAAFSLADGTKVKLTQETDYPVTNRVVLTVAPERAASFALKLRIPGWSQRTVLTVNGEPQTAESGTYATIARRWKTDDQVTLEFDFRGRIIRAPSGAPQQAVMRGPIVLAFDNRLAAEESATVWLLAQPLAYNGPPDKPHVLQEHNFPPRGEQGYVELQPVAAKDKAIRMAFEVPFFVRAAHFLGHRPKKLVMCDYASAGNQWSEQNYFRVWVPQPVYLGNLYPKGTWKVLASYGKTRTTIPPAVLDALRK